MNSLYEKILSLHQRHLKHTLVKQDKKLIITFSGVPGSGKTYLSKIIEERFKAVRVTKDDIRDILNHELKPEEIMAKNDSPKEVFKTDDEEELKEKYGLTKEDFVKENLANEYLGYFFEHYAFDNHLIIFDASVDRSFEKYKEFCTKKGYEMLVIKLPCDYETSYERIKQRGKEKKEDMNSFSKNFPRWKRDYENFNASHQVNIIFDDDIEKLFEKLDKVLKD